MKIIQRHVALTIVGYFLIAWVALTAVLFLQQSGRFAEILLGVALPLKLLFELGCALVLTVTAFTAPMAILAGIIVGLGQLRGDSEIIALAAAGFGQRAIAVPCLLLGFLASLVALSINLAGVPLAAQTIRRVTREAALIKLEAPVEPGVFNTDFNNYVIYVRGANAERQMWERVFIYSPDKNQTARVITAREGRIDSSSDKSELVLTDAVISTLPDQLTSDAQKQITVENLNSLRLSLGAGRKALSEQMQKIDQAPDEMTLAELSRYAAQKTGREQSEALILWHRRLALALAPLVLAGLGAAVGLRFGRSGRGWGSLLALFAMLVFYLFTLLCEQFVRVQILPVAIGAWLPSLIAGSLSVWWLWARGAWRPKNAFQQKLIFLNSKFFQSQFSGKIAADVRQRLNRVFNFEDVRRNFLGLLERDLVYHLLKYFFLLEAALCLLFLVFTVFEISRSIKAENSNFLLLKYLFFLSPMILLQIAPAALMLSITITYALKVRRNEVLVWGAAGQSAYVLLLPSFVLAIVLACFSWELQERLLPATNQKQDALRAILRGEGGQSAESNREGRFWVAESNGIYSFVARKQLENQTVKNVVFYKFQTNRTHLQEIYSASEGSWRDNSVVLGGGVSQIDWQGGKTETRQFGELQLPTENGDDPFDSIALKVSHLSSIDLEKLIQATESSSETMRLNVALQKRRANIFMFLVTVFFSAPLAISMRNRKVVSYAIAASIVIWLLLMTTSAIFEKLGVEGVLPVSIAVWSPLIIFSSVGWFLLARLRN